MGSKRHSSFTDAAMRRQQEAQRAREDAERKRVSEATALRLRQAEERRRARGVG